MSPPLPLLRLLAAAQFLWLLCCDAAGMSASALRGATGGRLKVESPRVRTGQIPADYDDSGSGQETHEVQLAVLDKLGEEIEGMRKQLRFLGNTLLPHGDRTEESLSDRTSTAAEDAASQVASGLMASQRSMTLLANHSHKQAALDMRGTTAVEDPGLRVSEEAAPEDEEPPEILGDEPNVEDMVDEEPQVEDEVPVEQETAAEGFTTKAFARHERAMQDRMLEREGAHEDVESEVEQSQEERESRRTAPEDESPDLPVSSDNRQLVDLAAAA